MRMLKMVSLAFLASSAMASSVTVSPNDPSGIVRSIVTNPAAKLNKVLITEIDGVLVHQHDGPYWLAPGKHQLKLAPVFSDLTGTVGSISNNHHKSHPLFELNVEQGKTYTLAAKQTDAHLNTWKAVIVSEKTTR
ncbi:MAG: hypothetical protein COW84_02555 [Gammaproteobacteria bacterium CG22_combo_CG10-13_8_21_14_all_40_8]|nr:MAG: hypothetical protein COW84_02555 [Gammaproteobacteria bacterium CG22_combo_CG10-13_8_21_14_all_40_8]